ncbi:MAG: papain-like cysteine protease family protein [Acidobacteriota bacterium]
MLLRVEPPGASSECYSRRICCDLPPSRTLDLVVERQQRSQWCWAAIGASLARFYRTGSWSQREIASEVFGVGSCEPKSADSWDRCATLDDVLRRVGCFSHWSPGRPTFERVQSEIAAGRPLCLGLAWSDGGNHYVVVRGAFAARRELSVDDPLHGPSIQHYDSFPMGYRGGGVWRETYWTVSGLESRATNSEERRGE